MKGIIPKKYYIKIIDPHKIRNPNDKNENMKEGQPVFLEGEGYLMVRPGHLYQENEKNENKVQVLQIRSRDSWSGASLWTNSEDLVFLETAVQGENFNRLTRDFEPTGGDILLEAV